MSLLPRLIVSRKHLLLLVLTGSSPMSPLVAQQVADSTYDVSVAKFGQIDNLVTDVSQFGERTNTYNGVEFSVRSRFGKGGTVAGGIGMGRTVIDNCAAPDFPATARGG